MSRRSQLSEPDRRAVFLPQEQSTLAPAFLLLPAAVRGDVKALYRVFRALDDAVDDHLPDARERIGAVEAWSREGCVTTPETRSLDRLARRYTFPHEIMFDFCRGMRHDLANEPIETEEELDRYCYRVAGTVGIGLTAILGARSPEATDGAVALATALQRTHILRDLDRDLARGRTYLAGETVRRCGSLEPGHREALLRDQIARADALFDAGIAGIRLLLRGRRAISAVALLYREVLREIERQAGSREGGRVVVPRWRSLLILARCSVAPL